MTYNRHYGDTRNTRNTLDEIRKNTKEEPEPLSQLEDVVNFLSSTILYLLEVCIPLTIQELTVKLYPVLVPAMAEVFSTDESKPDITSPLVEKSTLLLKRLRLLALEVDSITIRVNIP